MNTLFRETGAIFREFKSRMIVHICLPGCTYVLEHTEIQCEIGRMFNPARTPGGTLLDMT